MKIGKIEIVGVSKLIVKVFLLCFTILISQSCFLNHINDIDCSESIVQTAQSPDNNYVAAIIIENCHVTNPLITHVNIRRVGQEFTKDSNTNRILEGQVFRIRNDFPESKIEWVNERKLKFSCKGCLTSRISVKKERFEDIDVVYDLQQ